MKQPPQHSSSGLSRRIIEAQEHERRRIALELHDEIGQVLTAIKLALRRSQRGCQCSEARGPLTESLQLIEDAVNRVRDLALDLRPSLLDDFGLVEATRCLITRYAGQGTPLVHLDCEAVPERLDPLAEIVAFRLIQEALTNIVRHAQASEAWVQVSMEDGRLLISIKDDGIGFDVRASLLRARGGTSLGLLGMQERVRLIGGRWDLRSRRGRGTVISARLPLRRRPSAVTRVRNGAKASRKPFARLP